MALETRLYLIVAVVAAIGCGGMRAANAVTLQLYGNYHAMGVIVRLSAGEDPDQDATVALAYRRVGGAYAAGLPPARVAEDRFVGSLFWLQAGASYQVQVTIHEPDGGPLNGLVLTTSAATRAEPVMPVASRSLIAAPGGSGAACTLAAPCSVPTALGQVQPGEEVVFRGGVYRLGELVCPRSGRAGAPIVVRGREGETAVLDGADPDSFTWINHSGAVWRTTVHVADPHLVLANGQRLYPYQSLSDLQNLIWGIPGFFADGVTLYVRLAGNADPNSAAMTVSRFNHALYLDRNWIVLHGLEFRHYGQGEYAKAIYLRDASDVIIERCSFAVNDVGIGLKGEAHRNLIQDNEFFDTVFNWPWDAVKAGSGLETGGVVFYDPTTGRGNVIRNNVFHDYFDGFSVCPSDTAGLTNETDVYGNRVYRAGDDGMETDGRCSNVRIWGNTFHDVLMGISLAPVYTGPVYAIRNLIYRTGVGNNDYTGSPFKFNSGYGQSGPMYLFHNTCDAALPGNNGLYIKAPGSWTVIHSRNNIWAGTAYAVENYNTGEPVNLDYDNLWRETAGDLVRWDDVGYPSLGAFTAATGQEAHGLHAAPRFSNRAAGDYTLGRDSALIDAGTIIPGINASGYSGTRPDLGAFEYSAPESPAWLMLLLGT